ncbi:MAG: hypothetical protein AAFY56_13085 [Pseudomonadota bacterium]
MTVLAIAAPAFERSEFGLAVQVGATPIPAFSHAGAIGGHAREFP